MEERKAGNQDQELDQMSKEEYDLSLEEKDEIPEQEKEMDEAIDKESTITKKIETNSEKDTKEKIEENDSVIQQTKPVSWKKIRIVAGITLLAVVCGIIWFNWHYAGVDILYKTNNTPEVTTTPETEETETQEPTLSKEDVLTHYENLAIVDDKVNKYLNIRKEPSDEAQIIGKYVPYSYVNVVKEVEDGWYQVEIEGQTAYVAKSHVLTGERAKQLALEHCLHKVKVSKDGVKGYDGNTKKAKELVELVNGDSYAVVKDKENGWILIRARHNTECYVKAEDVTDGYYLNEGILFTSEGEISQTRLDFLNNAWQYLGGKYVWGGEELGVGVDCSGYIWKLLQQYDIHIHRVSIEQSQDGIEVKEEDMRPGDLIFYINRGDQISHVAIYTGSKTILHAASEEKGICLDAWDYLKPEAIRNVFGD
ncbi:Gamma-D-glutamyl-L-lysine endopeptidase [Clostridiales bacterium CHKCI001]|nr:Gamma-D-glutamyl-L-lysine endopeptidase [Clostridiales bacterium CHKCI001]